MATQVANTKANVQKRNDIATVQVALEKMKGQMAAALPNHIKPERMMRVALTAVQNTPKLLECDRSSFLLAVLRAAQLGLEPDGILGQAYLIPYGKQVQLIPGYKGLIDLARRSGEVSNIIAKEVCAKDTFDVDFSQEIPFVHKPLLEGERGEVKFFWAMARFKDGGFHWDYMTVDEVTKIRDGSSGWQSAVKFGKKADSPWEKHFIEMGKKTVIRRIAKFLPMSVQRAAAVEDMVDAGRKFEISDFGDIISPEDDGADNENANAMADVTPKQEKATATGNLKEKLKAKEQETPEEESTPEPEKSAETVQLAFSDGRVVLFPTEMDIVALMTQIQGMMPPDKDVFVAANREALKAVADMTTDKPAAQKQIREMIK